MSEKLIITQRKKSWEPKKYNNETATALQRNFDRIGDALWLAYYSVEYY